MWVKAQSNRIIAVSPTVECLCAAASLRPKWDTLQIAGGQLIIDRFKEWISNGFDGEVIICVARISDVEAVRKMAAQLSASGARLIWLVRQSSRMLLYPNPQSTVFMGPTLIDAAEKIGGKHIDHENPDLRDYLRYKISRSFMLGMNGSELTDALNIIAKTRETPFALNVLSKEDAASVQRFRDNDFPYIEGFNPPLNELKGLMFQIALSPMSVLITGETGTGKEAVALYLHEFSRRRKHPFVSINCAGLDEHFLRSELFGHLKGAFTGAVSNRKGLVAQASGGTLFLDELADMPLQVQADLLRFLQTRRFRPLGSDKEEKADVRLVAAAQPILYDKIKTQEFRSDLYYRIAETKLHTPRLAEVPDDILHIANNIIYRQIDHPYHKLFEAAEYFEENGEVLRRYDWPGNVRELASLIRRRIYLGDDVIGELERKMANGASSEKPALSFPRMKAPKDIRPARELMNDYVRHVWRNRGTMTQQQVADCLDLSVNTFKRIIAD